MLKILGLGLRIYGKLVSINRGPIMDEMERRTLNPNQVGLQGSGFGFLILGPSGFRRFTRSRCMAFGFVGVKDQGPLLAKISVFNPKGLSKVQGYNYKPNENP